MSVEVDSPAGKSHILYPAYINKSRTVAAGRRISLQYAVADPKLNEVAEALRALKGFNVVEERGKPYTRELDKESVNWRVKYDNLNPSKNNLKTKRQVLVACAKRINEIRSKSGPASNQPAETSGKQKKKNK